MVMGMTLTRTICVVLPDVIADDIDYFSYEIGLHMDDGEFAREAVRSMLQDVVAGYREELDQYADEYMMIRENHLDTRRYEFQVPEQMAVDIERFAMPLGYDMNRFIAMCLLRNMSRMDMYKEDVDCRLGDLDSE